MPKRLNASPPGKFDGADILFTEVTRATRASFETLFEQPGAPKYCWCMAWRHSPEPAQTDEKKRQMMALIDAGTPVGILAHIG
ncbi:GNAT family N-acetyltransferase, partial [Mesorhizobium sp. M2D.F.Ca.ET.145.01.1.1]